jgi:hypothetical protein
MGFLSELGGAVIGGLGLELRTEPDLAWLAGADGSYRVHCVAEYDYYLRLQSFYSLRPTSSILRIYFDNLFTKISRVRACDWTGETPLNVI